MANLTDVEEILEAVKIVVTKQALADRDTCEAIGLQMHIPIEVIFKIRTLVSNEYDYLPEKVK